MGAFLSKKESYVSLSEPILDGSAATEAKRSRAKRQLMALMGTFSVGGFVFYHFVEGWSLLESFVFTLSVVTGIGYGHVVPVTSAGMVFTAFYIVAGLVLFASVAGEILDRVMESETSTLLTTVKDAAEGKHEAVRKTYQEQVQDMKKHNFIVGCVNVAIFGLIAVLCMKFVLGEDWVHSLYLSSVYVLKLDSLCAVNQVRCNHKESDISSLLMAAAWYILSYGVIGHFLVSASNYLGSDPDATLSRLHTVTKERMERMDSDGDGKVSKLEFLIDRLTRDDLVPREVIDEIIANFDRFDTSKNGFISLAEIGQG